MLTDVDLVIHYHAYSGLAEEILFLLRDSGQPFKWKLRKDLPRDGEPYLEIIRKDETFRAEQVHAVYRYLARAIDATYNTDYAAKDGEIYFEYTLDSAREIAIRLQQRIWKFAYSSGKLDADKIWSKLEKDVKLLNEYLAGEGAYLHGDFVSYADISIYVAVRWLSVLAKAVKRKWHDEFPNLIRLRKDFESRPNIVASAKQMPTSIFGPDAKI